MIVTAALIRRPGLLMLVIAFLAFIALGLPDGVFGVAQPYVRDTFDIQLGSVGWYFVFITSGYVGASAFSGALVNRMGIGRLLAATCFITAIALLGYTIVPAWVFMVLLASLAGIGGGAIDAGINTYVAANYSPSFMFWLHACYGVGATLGPLIMINAINVTDTWRSGYVVLAAIQFTLSAVFFITADRWQMAHSTDTSDTPKTVDAPMLETLRRPVVWLSILTFFLYTGAEVAAGQWSYTLLFEGRGLSAETASLIVSIYWGLFSFGRITAGLITRRLDTLTFVRLNMVAAIGAALLLAWEPFELANMLALGLMGFAFAPTFPAMVSSTAERLGETHAANAIGFQISAAAAGGAILPGLTGVLAQNISLEVITTVLIVANVLIFFCHEATVIRKAPVATP